ncbi:MAG: uroporphyrinogen decarboxylase [Deltaproteobacteria bacterium]|nr:uroporphyrinogen decarboxylase [Deltaproteobacteria bacterium]
MDIATEISSNADFNGMRVVAFESRMADETRTLIERLGGQAIIAPSMREVPLEDNHAALAFAEKLLADEFEVVIFMTGVGVRELFNVIETRRQRSAIIAALVKVVTVARGPKPVAALRNLGMTPSITIPEPNTWRELLTGLGAQVALAGKRIAVQEYGVSNRELSASLEARGATVTVVPVYRWTLPEDREPLRNAIKTIAAGDADLVIFTSSNQVTNVLQVAADDGAGAALLRGLAKAVIASVGPVCSEELRRRGIGVDIEPEHPKLGHLVKAAATRGPAMLLRKRATESARAAGAGLRVTEVSSTTSQKTDLADSPVEKVIGKLRDHPFMRACRREPTPYTPIWLMRQAGRYMPEYRKVRQQHSFLEMCQQSDLAGEVTVTAVERLGVDAAIIFADILLPLVPMKVGLHYETGDGPIIDRPLRSASDLDRIPPVVALESLGFVAESIRLVRRALGDRTPLIGFAGAPFTLASYLIEGGSSRSYQATKTLMYTQPATWHRMMEMIARVTADYLNMQVDAGADVVQLFDSWVGSLSPDDYRRFVLPHTRNVISAVRESVPVIHFGTVTGNLLELMREAGGNVIGLDWRVDLGEAWARLGDDVAVQGNLDPIALFAEIPEIRRRARAILNSAAGRPGHIFNLGHGILPETPVDHVIALIDAVHEMSAR